MWPRDLEITYTGAFTDIVHELRGHIGAIRQAAAVAP
jgi:NitT/TauT family transport system ATP-binding protein